MEIIVDFKQNTAFSGLGTISFIAPAAQVYKFEAHIQLPNSSFSGLDSAVIVTINKNGSPVYVGSKAAQGFEVSIDLLTSDTVTIVLASAASADQPKNVVKSMISISSGE